MQIELFKGIAALTLMYNPDKITESLQPCGGFPSWIFLETDTSLHKE